MWKPSKQKVSKQQRGYNTNGLKHTKKTARFYSLVNVALAYGTIRKGVQQSVHNRKEKGNLMHRCWPSDTTASEG